MSRQKPIFYSNKYERKNVVQFSIKMPAKRPDQGHKKMLQGQSSAHTGKRPQIPDHLRLDQSTSVPGENNIFYKPSQQLHKLNEDQIRNSALYKHLQEEINELVKSEGDQIKKLKNMKEDKKTQLQSVEKENHGIKLQIWQLRNEALELKESIEEEKNESERLMEELGDRMNHNEENADLNEDDDDL